MSILIKLFKKHKFILLFSLVFLLSGCDGSAGYSYHGSGWGMTQIDQFYRTSSWDSLETGNNIIFNIRESAISSSQGNITQVFDSLSSISVLPQLIQAIQIISILLIIIRFAWIVFKSYTLSFGEGDTPITFNLLKKTLLALIFVYLAPIIIINGFLFTSVLAGQTVTYVGLDDSVTESGANVPKDLAWSYVSLNTYCFADDGRLLPSNDFMLGGKSGLVKYDQSMFALYNNPNILTFNDVKNSLSTASLDYNYSVLYPSGHAENTGAFMSMMYSRYCSTKVDYSDQGYIIPYSVKHAIDANPALRRPEEIIDRTTNTLKVIYKDPLLYTGGGGAGFQWLLSLSFILIFGAVAFFATATRIGELLITIIATPFFAMNYITTERTQIMVQWVTELTSIFLTHIITVIGFMIGMIELAKPWSSTTPLVAGGMIWVVMKGPQIIRNWTNATGAGGALSSGARGALGAIKNI